MAGVGLRGGPSLAMRVGHCHLGSGSHVRGGSFHGAQRLGEGEAGAPSGSDQASCWASTVSAAF